jgi:hypothetical protein
MESGIAFFVFLSCYVVVLQKKGYDTFVSSQNCFDERRVASLISEVKAWISLEQHSDDVEPATLGCTI